MSSFVALYLVLSGPCLVSSLPYKLVVLWESSVITGRRRSFAFDLKGLRRVQLASWRNLILTFRFDSSVRLYGQVRTLSLIVGASLEGLNLI